MPQTSHGANRARSIARWGGPLAGLAAFLLAPASLPPEAQRTLGAAAWMVVWWITECVPILATSLLPLALFPVLGIATSAQAAAPYANELVFLFLAGFLLAAGLEQWSCHVRIAYRLLALVGLTSRRAVLAVMLATGCISMWISNTATAAMMYPIALAIAALFPPDEAGGEVRAALMLGVAYAASIGGMGTMIGTPPNLVVAGALRELAGRPVSFVEFMALGMPMVLLLLPLCWVILVFVCFRRSSHLGAGGQALVRERLQALGPVRGGEAKMFLVFGATALAWILREPKDLGGVFVPGLTQLLPALSDAAIGVLAAVLLFLVPGRTAEGEHRPLLTWAEARQIPWDVLFFFGGGLSLAAVLERHGLTTWLGQGLAALEGLPPWVIYLGLAGAVVVLSELASNLAVATMMMPIAAALGRSLGQPPALLMLVAGFAASAGFALPIATPPNAIVFGSGAVTVRQMGRAGVLLDVVAIVVIGVVIALLGPLVLGSG
ncbi:MAG: SLC13/DASS family transporter [Gemmatimonadetes bacterium]|nr:SLC13/DASS family transporter [Gemmatimonadota bacterium]MBK7348611.1 SLC13/DASS family transporter [Gemmatimonadota bacterium]MBK7783239.1 SLC13/DASS family transporter [Gemmatimonadota bacterium]MBK7924181.1 SLC13/DASS family transporter [Gemmatimonadota bacterium]MBP9201474.1 SLC13/DASS family transporter [Gemmatimonadales bacterium]